MPSSNWRTSLAKDCRELFGSTAFALLALVAGPLTGMSFLAAMRAYAEASGAGGGAAALSSALSPLDGILVPTLGACDLLITFLVPFVAIRLIADEKRSGALALLLQTPLTIGRQLFSKMAALLAGWLIVLIPAFAALAFWSAAGGHLDPGETLNLFLGHTLRYVFTCALSIAAAAMFDGAASAAIAVLAFTIGTWALDFFAAGRGGWIASLARYTPAAVLRWFERGLLDFEVIAVTIAAVGLLTGIAAIALDRPAMRGRRVTRVITALLFVAITFVVNRRDHSLDVSEDRRNSFSAADEQILRSIETPVTIRVYIAAEDPRANDYERNVLTKLRRTLRHLQVDYPYAGQSALFENDDRYGTVLYRIGTKETVSRSTTEEIVLDDLETLAGRKPPQRGEPTYPGYPLPTSPPRAAALAFYLVWPLLVAAVWLRGRLR